MATYLSIARDTLCWFDIYSQFYKNKNLAKFIRINKNKSINDILTLFTTNMLNIFCEPLMEYIENNDNNTIFFDTNLSKEEQIKIYVGMMVKALSKKEELRLTVNHLLVMLGRAVKLDVQLPKTLGSLGATVDVKSAVTLSIVLLSSCIEDSLKINSGLDIYEQIVSYVSKQIVDEVQPYVKMFTKGQDPKNLTHMIVTVLESYNRIMTHKRKR